MDDDNDLLASMHPAEKVLLALFAPGLPSPGQVIQCLVIGVIVLAVVLVLVLFVASLWERRYLAGDVQPVAEPFPYPPTRYWIFTRRDAVHAGLRHIGDFATRKNTSMLKGLEAVFLTRNGDTAVIIASGGFGLKRTIMLTRLATGSILESTDLAGTPDYSGVIQREMLLYAGVVELLEFHRQRVAAAGGAVVPFSDGNEPAELEMIQLEMGARWVAMGLARWADPKHTAVRMTLRGAITVTINVFANPHQRKPQTGRVNIARAGARPIDVT